MEVIVPAAGLSTRFPNMKPKYLLKDNNGEMMIQRAIKQFLDEDYSITVGVLKEHDDLYGSVKLIEQWANVVVLETQTKGPADTVYQILKKMNCKDTPIFVKDCDSYFNHKIESGNYVCVSHVSEHEILRNLAAKSFTIANEHGIIKHIVEKKVVSDNFCIGGYKFNSSKLFMTVFENLQTNREVFVSDVIEILLGNGEIFFNKEVQDYVDVGTIETWSDYNEKVIK